MPEDLASDSIAEYMRSPNEFSVKFPRMAEFIGRKLGRFKRISLKKQVVVEGLEPVRTTRVEYDIGTLTSSERIPEYGLYKRGLMARLRSERGMFKIPKGGRYKPVSDVEFGQLLRQYKEGLDKFWSKYELRGDKVVPRGSGGLPPSMQKPRLMPEVKTPSRPIFFHTEASIKQSLKLIVGEAKPRGGFLGVFWSAPISTSIISDRMRRASKIRPPVISFKTPSFKFIAVSKPKGLPSFKPDFNVLKPSRPRFDVFKILPKPITMASQEYPPYPGFQVLPPPPKIPHIPKHNIPPPPILPPWFSRGGSGWSNK